MNDFQPRICFVIINYNSLEYTKECILSLQDQSYQNFKILVVDNDSSDNSILELKKMFTELEIIKNEANLGYTGACNIGIQYSLQMNYDFIFLLNNDTTAHPKMLEELVNYIKRYPDTTLLTGKIYYKDFPNKVWYSGGKLNLIKLEGIHKGVNKYEVNIQCEKESIVDFASGCMMLIKSDIFKDIGYFDEFLFAYYEDVDFCIRLKRHNYKIVYVPTSRIWHKISPMFSSNQKIVKFTKLTYYLKTRNKIYLTLKYKVKWQKLITFILIAPKIFKYFFGFMLLLRIEYLRYVVYGIVDGLSSNRKRIKQLLFTISG